MTYACYRLWEGGSGAQNSGGGKFSRARAKFQEWAERNLDFDAIVL